MSTIPADGKVIGTVAKATIADLDDALAAAAKGFEIWRNTPAFERARLMRAAAALLRERSLDIARMMTLEQGKPWPKPRSRSHRPSTSSNGSPKRANASTAAWCHRAR